MVEKLTCFKKNKKIKTIGSKTKKINKTPVGETRS